MPRATDEQVQTFSDERVRTFAELSRLVDLFARDHKAAIDDVYNHCSDAEQAGTWIDDRTDGPPHLVTRADIIEFNTFITQLIAILDNTTLANDAAKGDAVDALAASWVNVKKACVRPPKLQIG